MADGEEGYTKGAVVMARAFFLVSGLLIASLGVGMVYLGTGVSVIAGAIAATLGIGVALFGAAASRDTCGNVANRLLTLIGV
jgi:hypothetical protein